MPAGVLKRRFMAVTPSLALVIQNELVAVEQPTSTSCSADRIAAAGREQLVGQANSLAVGLRASAER